MFHPNDGNTDKDEKRLSPTFVEDSGMRNRFARELARELKEKEEEASFVDVRPNRVHPFDDPKGYFRNSNEPGSQKLREVPLKKTSRKTEIPETAEAETAALMAEAEVQEEELPNAEAEPSKEAELRSADPETAEVGAVEPEAAEPVTKESIEKDELQEEEISDTESETGTAAEPETEAPEAAEPEAEEPEAAEPEIQEPETKEPEAEEPEAAEPEIQEPETQEPETEKPEITESEAAEPEGEEAEASPVIHILGSEFSEQTDFVTDENEDPLTVGFSEPKQKEEEEPEEELPVIRITESELQAQDIPMFSEDAREEQEKSAPAVSQNVAKKSGNAGSLIAAAEFLLAVGLLAGAYYTVNSKCGPEAAVKTYWNAVSVCDWGSAYEVCAFPDSNLLRAESFAAVHQGETPVLSRTVTVTESGEGDNVYLVHYQNEGTAEEKTVQVQAVKTGEKQFLFWDEWKVVPDDVLVADAKLDVPAGSVVSLNGADISGISGVESDTEGNMVQYQIPYLFSGDYQLTVAMESMETYREVISVSNENKSFVCSHLVPSAETLQAVMNQAGADLMTIMGGYWKQIPFGDVQKLFTSEVINRGILRAEYEEALATADARHVADAEITGITVQVQEIREGEMDLVVNYHYRESFYGEDTTLETEEKDTYATMTYHSENGQWKLSNLPQ